MTSLGLSFSTRQRVRRHGARNSIAGVRPVSGHPQELKMAEICCSKDRQHMALEHIYTELGVAGLVQSGQEEAQACAG